MKKTIAQLKPFSYVKNLYEIKYCVYRCLFEQIQRDNIMLNIIFIMRGSYTGTYTRNMYYFVECNTHVYQVG